MPQGKNESFFQGYARRTISAYVPKKSDDLMTFEALSSQAEGKQALMSLKGDIDNLGYLFQTRIKQATFATYAAMSRRINAFFTFVLPAICQEKRNNIYTIFAGGDDFFFMAPWDKQIAFLKDIKQLFDQYVCRQVSFSAGLLMTHATMPVRITAELTEEALEAAKQLPDKNSVSCFNQPVPFDAFFDLLKLSDDLCLNGETYRLSTGFIYRLITLCEKAERAKTHVQDAIWRSWLAYRITRHLKDMSFDDDKVEQGIAILSEHIGGAIEKYTERYKIALFMYLYRLRGEE